MPLHSEEPTGGVTGVILAGGQSSRMGSNKALLPYRGGRFIEAIHRQLSALFPEVLLVTNTPEQYAFLPCRMVADIHPGMGALAGLHAGLHHAPTPYIFAVACDMPYLDNGLIQLLTARRHGADVVIPQGEHGPEPLHAVYARRCLPAMEAALLAGKRRIVSFFPQVRVQHVGQAKIAGLDPEFMSFRNINTPEEYYDLRRGETSPAALPEQAEGSVSPASLSIPHRG
jgi:molybdopterin-guanine dinucleotide biosynthesis protein A